MANPEHLRILMQGATAWNVWRKQHGDVRPELSGANLVAADLGRANLVAANLRGANLRGANLVRADLRGADLTEARIRRAYLFGADLREADFFRADLSGATLSGATLTEAILTGADLTEAHLVRATLREATFFRTTFSRATLREAHLVRATLTEAILTGADLSGAILTGATLTGADLSGAILTGATLTGADLSGAILTGTILTGADLSGAILTGATLTGADLSGADVSEVWFSDTVLSNTTLTAVQSLETCRHAGPSALDHRTLAQSGPLPLAFLRGCGLNDWEIEVTKLYQPGLTPTQINDIIYRIYDLRADPLIQFHSCFISYTSQDQAFANRLYADLQYKGVRCWYAPEDIKIGDEFRSRIDTSIHLHDRLLLILSEHAIKSRWVKKEVETAFEKEENEHRLILLPIRLDDAVMDIKVGWAADIRRQRLIGDFTRWKEHDAYQQAFTRLLRDLKAESRQPQG